MITDDAILVNMALGGKSEAFDELVRKHRSRVLSVARMLVGTADGAEDVAQQAFMAAFINLRLLQDPASFRPWLMTITRRCAFRRRTVQSRETTELNEAVITSPYHQPDDTEAKARIAEMLAELSARNRKIVVLHYLDGFSCREIGESIGIPPGTVRRILHESRNSLRASSEMMRGASEMAQKKQGPRHMEWSVNGQWPDGMMDSVLRQSICLTINKSGLTPEQIAKRIDANEVYVREALDVLEAEELVAKVGRGRYRTVFVALDAEDRIEISRKIRARSESVADLLTGALPELQAAWESSPKLAQGFDWNTGIWPTLAIMVCNTGIFRNGSVDTGLRPPVHPSSGAHYWAQGRENVTPEYVLWDTGFSVTSARDAPVPSFHHGLFWTHGLPFARPAGHPDRDGMSILRALASGFSDIDSIAQAAGLNTEKVREAAADAIEIKMFRREQDGLALTFPVFTDEDDKAMLPIVDKVCKRLAQEVDWTTRLVDEKFPELGFGHLEEQFCTWRGLLRGSAAAEGLRFLYNRGILPHPGDPAPVNFCMVGWFDQTRLFSYYK
ncbi:sigma-70 family RNA polymerase sigma factor [bacterium]|nr:sigma-70 family RNA polymerase sigma factor [bacterium]